MLLPGEEPLATGEPPASGITISTDLNHQDQLSPSIQRVVGEAIAAYEMKFLIDDALAQQVEDWAAAAMIRDAYADPAQGGYQTTTLYLDTPGRDVFMRSEGHRRRKFRLRRYGSEQRIYLERKTRQGNRVAKRRSDVPLCELGGLTCPIEDLPQTHTNGTGNWPGQWFRERVVKQSLMPTCLLTYDRTAFVRPMETGMDGPLRLTLDRRIRGQAAQTWELIPLDGGHAILPGQVICEFKFRGAMPNVFKEVINRLQLQPGSVSKYRRMMLATEDMPQAVAANILGDMTGMNDNGSHSDPAPSAPPGRVRAPINGNGSHSDGLEHFNA